MYSDLPRADVRELRRYVDLPFELSEGDGALRGWFEVHEGRPEAATLDVSLRAVALRLDKRVAALEFEEVEGRFDARKKGDRIAIEARGFGFVTGDGIRWPKGDLSVAWVHPEGEDVTSGEFSADRLDIGVMAGIAGRVPLGAALRALLADVHPQGVITQLSARWDGPIDAPAHYRVKGKLTGLSLSAHAGERHDAVGRPGLRNATVQLDAGEAGGEARIGLEQGVVELPGVFDEPALPFDRLDAKLDWKIERRPGAAPNITVRVREASFANPDAEGELSATWRTGAGEGMARGGRFPGVLELDGRIGNARAARTVRYLPLGLPDSVRGYVSRSVLDGSIERASFRVRGDLWDFPFHGGKSGREGEFRVEAKVAGLVFAYIPAEAPASRPGEAGNPNWPSLTDVSGELIIDKTRLEIRNARARLGGADWTGVRGAIPQLGDHARFEIEGMARGPLAEMLRFVNATPVGRWTGRALATASGSGNADLKLALDVPLDHPSETKVKGSLALAGNDVRMTPDTPLLGAAKARIDFTQSAFTVVTGNARVLGGDMSFEGGSQGDSQRFTAQGTVTAEALRNSAEVGLVARLPLSGQAGYRATLAFVGGQPQLGVTSNLVGLGVELPQPLGKAAAAPLALRVQSGLDDGAPVATGREAWRVEVGSVLQARFLREGAGDGAQVRGAIRLFEPVTPAPAETSEPLVLPAAASHSSTLSLRTAASAVTPAADRVFAEPARGSSPAPGLDSGPVAGYFPDQVGLRVGELTMGSRRLVNVVAGLSQDGGLWRVNVGSDELDGYVEYRHPRRGVTAGGPGAGRIYARLSRLNLPKGEAERVESLLDEPPASVPALDIVVDDFELRGKRLGRLEIEAANRSTGGRDAIREWRLSKFNLTLPEARLVATGTWGAGAVPGVRAPSRAAMDFTLTLADSGAFVERLGMGKVLRGGKGSLSGSVSWPGSPLSPDTAKMSGQLKVAIDAGQVLNASPGAARLLGVFSMQSLQRRLLLDFRDLFEDGFVFDNVTGDLKLGAGVATTNNLRMRGPAAVVLMEGEADIERETQNLRVFVVPEINAGTASLAYAFINPAIGLGTFLAQYFLSKPIAEASTREFRVTGPWDDPKVERVERTTFGGKPAGEAPDAAAAADPPKTTTTR